MNKIRFLTTALLFGTCLLGASGCSGDISKPYIPGEKVKVGLICLHSESSTYDKNFIDAWKSAFQSNEKVEFDAACIKTDVPEGAQAFTAAKALVKQGCNMIFADSFGHGPYILKAAKKFKNVQFCHATGTGALTAGVDNLHDCFASIYEGRYLAGVAAGYALKNKGCQTTDAVKAGYVGAWPYAEVVSGYTSWYLGLKSVFPNATMEVKYTFSWYDETGEREAANALISNGCQIISQHADSMGAPSACQNADPKVPNVCYNVSTEAACGDTYVCHSAINWAPYFNAVVNAMYADTAIEGEVNNNWAGTMNAGSVTYGVTSNTNLLTATDISALSTLETELKGMENPAEKIFNVNNFTVTVTADKNTNATVDQQGHLTNYMADVDGDYAPDSEVVLQGNNGKYFAESKFRASPYFDIIIDGITILG